MADRLAADLHAAFAEVLGEDHVIVDPDRLATYETDVTRRYSGRAAAVVRPGSTGEVAAVLRLCTEADVAVVPQGGNTGLAGGAVPLGGEVVLSMVRLDELGPVDDVEAAVTAGAGVTLGQLQRHLSGTSFEFGVDFAARDSATIGGMIATNAGGARVLRHGPAGRQVRGLEAVLADGERIDRMRGLKKETTGYSFEQLLVGSEGTLAVITRARLALVPRPPQRVVALVGLHDTGEAVALVSRLRSSLDGLEAADIFFADGLELVCRHRGLARPLPGPFGAYLLLECAGRGDVVEQLASALGDAAEDVAVAEDTAGRAALWEYREAHNEAIAAQGIPHKLDIALPIREVASVEAAVRDRVAQLAPAARTIIYGHLGEGNLHVNILGLDPNDVAVDTAVLELVSELGGAISAEHGIGQSKVPWLHLSRAAGDIAAMRRIKRALDPGSRLNPAKLFQVEG